jgi:hypothetical protein
MLWVGLWVEQFSENGLKLEPNSGKGASEGIVDSELGKSLRRRNPLGSIEDWNEFRSQFTPILARAIEEGLSSEIVTKSTLSSRIRESK